MKRVFRSIYLSDAEVETIDEAVERSDAASRSGFVRAAALARAQAILHPKLNDEHEEVIPEEDED